MFKAAAANRSDLVLFLFGTRCIGLVVVVIELGTYLLQQQHPV